MLVWIGSDKAIRKRLSLARLQSCECLVSMEAICAAEFVFTIINSVSLGELNG